MPMRCDRTPELICKCGNKDLFNVLGLVPAVISCQQGGVIEVDSESVMVTDESNCMCAKCGKRGSVYDFLCPEDKSLADAVGEAEDLPDGFIVDDVVGRA